MDMDDMFWQIPQNEVLACVDWLFFVLDGSFSKRASNRTQPKKEVWFSIPKTGDKGLDRVGKSAVRSFFLFVGECKKRRRGTRLWFSLSREARSLDRVGKSSHRQFRILSEEEVTCFVDYDPFDNVLFILQRLVLQQGGSGVPIGGFISAQLAELWALWRENVKLRGEDAVRQGFESDWNRALHNDPPVFESVKPPDGHPRPNMQGNVSGKTDFSMSPDTSDKMQVRGNMMRSPAPHLVSWPALSEAGFQGWWSPVESLVAVLQVIAL